MREGATNVLRHALARRCTVRATSDGDVLRLELVNDGASGAGSDGTGLASLRERAAHRGGRLEAGPVEGGGFRLAVELPGAAVPT